jgi:ribose transport system substrate-binding protein
MTLEAQDQRKTLHPHHLRNFLLILCIPIIIAAIVAWRAGLFLPSPRIAIITSTSDAYWDRVIAGAKAAGRHFGVDVTEIRVNGDETQQSKAIQDAVSSGHNGLAVSPVNPLGQAVMLSDVASKTALVTFDSDCAAANRLAFIGTNNYIAGWQLAPLVHDACPDGGEIIISVGSMDKENGKQRRQGLIDALLDRPLDVGRSPDPVDAELKHGKYTIDATLVDNVDIPKVTTLALDAIKKYPNVKCIVGLYGYSAPALLDALRQSGTIGKIKIIAFDEAEATLAGIEAGQIYGTLVQDQYNMGYDTVRFLVESIRHLSSGETGATRMEYLVCRPVVGADDVKMIRYEKLLEANPEGSPPPPPETAPASQPTAATPVTLSR